MIPVSISLKKALSRLINLNEESYEALLKEVTILPNFEENLANREENIWTTEPLVEVMSTKGIKVIPNSTLDTFFSRVKKKNVDGPTGEVHINDSGKSGIKNSKKSYKIPGECEISGDETLHNFSEQNMTKKVDITKNKKSSFDELPSVSEYLTEQNVCSFQDQNFSSLDKDFENKSKINNDNDLISIESSLSTSSQDLESEVESDCEKHDSVFQKNEKISRKMVIKYTNKNEPIKKPKLAKYEISSIHTDRFQNRNFDNVKKMKNSERISSDVFSIDDISEEDELYVMKCPQNMCLDSLKEKEIILGNGTMLQLENTGKKINCTSYIMRNKDMKLNIFASKRASNNVRLGTFPLMGYINLIENEEDFNLANNPCDMNEIKPLDTFKLPEGIKFRHSCAGAIVNSVYEGQELAVAEKKKGKKRKRLDTDGENNNAVFFASTLNTVSEELKRRKNKLYEGTDELLNEEAFINIKTERTDLDDPIYNGETSDTAKPLKKKKKKKKNTDYS